MNSVIVRWYAFLPVAALFWCWTSPSFAVVDTVKVTAAPGVIRYGEVSEVTVTLTTPTDVTTKSVVVLESSGSAEIGSDYEVVGGVTFPVTLEKQFFGLATHRLSVKGLRTSSGSRNIVFTITKCTWTDSSTGSCPTGASATVTIGGDPVPDAGGTTDGDDVATDAGFGADNGLASDAGWDVDIGTAADAFDPTAKDGEATTNRSGCTCRATGQNRHAPWLLIIVCGLLAYDTRRRRR